MELNDYLRLLRRRGWLVVLCGLLGLAGAYVANNSATTVYGSSVTFYLAGADGRPLSGEGTEGVAGRFATYSRLVSSLEVRRAVADEVSVPGQLLSVEATPVGGTVFYTLQVRADSPEAAQAYATAYAVVLPEAVTDFEGEGSTLAIFESPLLQPQQLAPDERRNLLAGLALGVVLGVCVALVVEALDNRLRTTEEIERYSRTALLATVPHELRNQHRAAETRPASKRAEAVRQIRANLQFSELERPFKVLVVTSAAPGEGKTTLAVDLALTLAQAGRRVVLVDADLRRPSVSTAFSVTNTPGLTEALIGETSLPDALVDWKQSGLKVLPSGAPLARPGDLLGSTLMGELVSSLLVDHELVVLDTSPLLPVADTTSLLTHADAVLMVVQEGETTRRQLSQATARLEQAGARVVGVVANARRWSSGSSGERFRNPYGRLGKDLRDVRVADLQRRRGQDEPPEGRPASAPASEGGSSSGEVASAPLFDEIAEEQAPWLRGPS